MNGRPQALPFVSGNLRIYIHDSNVVFDAPEFLLNYDGIHFIKIRQCGPNICGICGNNNDNPFDDGFNPEIFRFRRLGRN